ncbi:hypothetical protein MTR_6g084305 [Medicago truncatula]|uniref:Uncharacterized protein n=1 Tax=Medicago truncatula TaxID=3880 RepID=A0A072UME3_MEDTR|nr:hypothetical protein MTR_6g084305 [Medicago truncatula]
MPGKAPGMGKKSITSVQGAVRGAAKLQTKVREYSMGYAREKAWQYTRGLAAPRFYPRGVAPGKNFAMSAFATASAPGFFPHKRPFCHRLCTFDRDFAPGKR